MGQPSYPQQYPPQSGPYPYAPPKKSGCGTIAIVVLVVGLVVLVVFGGLAAYGVKRYLVQAKASEAKATVHAIYRGAEDAYERDGKLCGSSTRVPERVPMGAQSKASELDFDSGDETTGWKCLRFSLGYATYFSYTYTRDDAEHFTVRAEGDLDGDGETSTYMVKGSVTNGRVAPMPPLEITNEGE